MIEFIRHDVQKGVRRLLSAPKDFQTPNQFKQTSFPKFGATSLHQGLYLSYAELLNLAADQAVKWWVGMINRMIDQGVKVEDAIRECYMERLAGPASHPHIVFVVRKYWLECEAINGRIDYPNRVPPEVFLLAWLVDDRCEQPVQVLSAMPYWPIGLDEDGNWV